MQWEYWASVIVSQVSFSVYADHSGLGHAHTRVTNLFTNAVFSSPEVKFQVYEKLKYGEEK